jgi:hypothetical protein
LSLFLRLLLSGLPGSLLEVQLLVVHLFIDFLRSFLAQPEAAEDLENPAQDFLEPLEELLGPAAADAGAARDEQEQEEEDEEGDEVARKERAALTETGATFTSLQKMLAVFRQSCSQRTSCFCSSACSVSGKLVVSSCGTGEPRLLSKTVASVLNLMSTLCSSLPFDVSRYATQEWLPRRLLSE